MGSKLVNCAAIFVVKDVIKTSEYYKTVLGCSFYNYLGFSG
jgi:hypothetical protein